MTKSTILIDSPQTQAMVGLSNKMMKGPPVYNCYKEGTQQSRGTTLKHHLSFSKSLNKRQLWLRSVAMRHAPCAKL